MIHRLRCYSFHSVKGGVGKSTLSVLTAVALADANPRSRVYVVDMDLTGTSLADVLPLEAPAWERVGPRDRIDLLAEPKDFHAHDESSSRIEERGQAPTDITGAVSVPFLNDYLLFSPAKWDETMDIPPSAISWRLQDGPKNLRVLPSSALPRDLARALPVIYDEEHAAFLEGRLEYLFAALLHESEEVFVVFDTPPTIPGLSRSVLNLAFRLSNNPKTPLSEDGFMLPTLGEARVEWRAFLVATQDYQDVRAAARWLDLVRPEDPDILRLLLNRVHGQEEQGRELHEDALRDRSANPHVLNPIWIKEEVSLQTIFRGEDCPPIVRDVLLKLDREPEPR
ncbi:P-loop NTPase [Sorangium sp. So ce726]|uniref:P-loop NTPase n=1 Tax=Sorangium sp. So ce726 TaxID=3133319 RepID=UPI003F5EDE11